MDDYHRRGRSGDDLSDCWKTSVTTEHVVMWCEGDDCRHSVEPLEVLWTSDGDLIPELCPLCVSTLSLDPSCKRTEGENDQAADDHARARRDLDASADVSVGSESRQTEPVLGPPDGGPVVAVEVGGLAAGEVAEDRSLRDGLREASREMGLEQRNVPGCVRVRRVVLGPVQARSLVAQRGVSGYPVAAVPYRAGHSCQVRVLGLGLSERLACNGRRKKA